jgi:hypothetical protein
MSNYKKYVFNVYVSDKKDGEYVKGSLVMNKYTLLGKDKADAVMELRNIFYELAKTKEVSYNLAYITE